MPQHVGADRLHVLRRDVAAMAQERVRAQEAQEHDRTTVDRLRRGDPVTGWPTLWASSLEKYWYA